MEYRVIRSDGDLQHSGILGMKWGIRRFQNEDGSLTEAGKIRYAKQQQAKEKRELKIAQKQSEKEAMANRKKEAKQRAKLTKMKPSLLTDQELKDLNNRAQMEQNFVKNYQEKGKKASGPIKNALVHDVLKPTLVAAGKSFAISAFSGKDFEDVMSNELNKAFKIGNNNSNDKQQKQDKLEKARDNGKNESKKGLFKKKGQK